MTTDPSLIALFFGVIAFIAEVLVYMRKFSPESILVTWVCTMIVFLIIYLLNANALADMVMTENNRKFAEGAVIPIIIGTLNQMKFTAISYSILTSVFIAFRLSEIEKELERKYW
ncbi:hypothetical protein HJ167_18400 [Vibrio parahaemolyticus]|nr:hypothetical protein [Vibrio parahaemolyticus]